MYGMYSRRKGSIVSTTSNKISPIGGLNRRDPIANMPIGDAFLLENWFPKQISLETRRGSIDDATGLPDDVETLMNYELGNTRQLFAVSEGKIYDVSSSGAVGSALETGLNSNRFHFVQTENSAGGRFLIAVNGMDTPLIYNGTSWADASFTGTGLTPANLDYVAVYNNRLYFLEKNTFNIWYGDTYAISGTLSKFNLNSIVTDGGKFIGIATMTVDNTAGIDEFIAFFTDTGQVIMYTGSDPSSASSWQKSGIFKISRPIGRNFITKINGDPALLTADGVFMLSRALLTDRSQSIQSVSSKINGLIRNDYKLYGQNYGWQILYHPDNEKLYVNVPANQGVLSHQYVMNTETGAWTRFTGWQSNYMIVKDGIVHCGSNQKTLKIDVGFNDNGQSITAKAVEAFDAFNNRTVLKDFKSIRPIFRTSQSLIPAISMNVDYNVKSPQNVITVSGGVSAVWDIGVWNVDIWGGKSQTFAKWKSVNGKGFVAALNMDISISGFSVEWQATDYLYEIGGVS